MLPQNIEIIRIKIHFFNYIRCLYILTFKTYLSIKTETIFGAFWENKIQRVKPQIFF